MAAATPDGGGLVGGYGDLPGLGNDDHVGMDGSSSSCYISVKEEEEEASLTMDQWVRLAEMWVASPTTSHHLTTRVGGVLLDEDIWEVRIHFYAREPLERKLTREKGLDLVDSNSELQMIKSTLKRNIADDTLVLNMLAGACPSSVSKFVRQECDEQQSDEQQSDEKELSTIVYEEHVSFDLSDTHVFVVDQHGVVFESQGSSFTRAHLPGAYTQESKNVNDKLKCVLEEEEEERYKYDVYEDSDVDLEIKRERDRESKKSDPTTGIQTIIDVCMEKYGVDVPKSMAYRAKNIAIEAVLGDHKLQYPRLRDYAQTFMDTNTGSRVMVTKVTPIPTEKIPHPDPRFHAMFFCINGSRERFLKGYRPFIVNVVLPNYNQRFCLRHIYASFQIVGFRGEDLKKCMFNASYAFNEHKFNIAMMDLRAESEEAWQWLSAIPTKTWARHAFDTNCKTDLVVNNLSEVFNKYILDVRRKPIRTMCDGIKDKKMVRWHGNSESEKTARWRVTPHYSEKLEIEKERVKYCKPMQDGVNLWKVTSGPQTHAVNLELQTCGCRKWNLTRIPCNHAISAINKAKRLLQANHSQELLVMLPRHHHSQEMLLGEEELAQEELGEVLAEEELA
ncbi:hypothetical protein D1007_12845 [Hordeum vulgare]|nr:hypothetical protein D1007_12845 [Hordeum vulgare]